MSLWYMITNMKIAEWQNKANFILGAFYILYSILIIENNLITDKNLFTISNASSSYDSILQCTGTLTQ